jgi:Phage Mu protein F like protein
MAPPSQEEVQEQQRRTRRRLLEAEAAFLLLLRRGHPAPRTSQSPEDAAFIIERSLTPLYAVGRRWSREAGVARLHEELAAYDVDDPLPPKGGPYRSTADALRFRRQQYLDDLYDAQRARDAASGYSGAWLDSATDALADGEPDPYGFATRAQRWRLEMGATTESSEAYNLARDRSLQQLSLLNPTANEELVKIWDATLDKQTCPVCGEASGTIVGLRESFPQGVPGHVHPRCRCVEEIIPLSIAVQRGGARDARSADVHRTRSGV